MSIQSHILHTTLTNAFSITLQLIETILQYHYITLCRVRHVKQYRGAETFLRSRMSNCYNPRALYVICHTPASDRQGRY